MRSYDLQTLSAMEFSLNGTNSKQRETLGSLSSLSKQSTQASPQAGQFSQQSHSHPAQPAHTLFTSYSKPFNAQSTPIQPLKQSNPPSASNSPSLNRLTASKLNLFEDFASFSSAATQPLASMTTAGQSANKKWDFDVLDVDKSAPVDVFGMHIHPPSKVDNIDDIFATFDLSHDPPQRTADVQPEQDMDEIFSSFDRAPPVINLLVSSSAQHKFVTPIQPTSLHPLPTLTQVTYRDESIALLLSKGFPLHSIISALDLTNNNPTLALKLLQEDHAVRHGGAQHPSTITRHTPTSTPSSSYSHTTTSRSQSPAYSSSYSSAIDTASKYGVAFVSGAKKVLDASRRKLVDSIRDSSGDEEREERYINRRRDVYERRSSDVERDQCQVSNRSESPENVPVRLPQQADIFDVHTILPNSSLPLRDERVSDLLNMDGVEPPAPITIRDRFPLDLSIISTAPQATLDSTLRDRGNVLYKAGQYPEAIDMYTQALTHCAATHRIPLLNNRALAYLKTGQANLAVQDCTTAIHLCKTINGSPDDLYKSHFRRACANESLEKYVEAGEDYRGVIGEVGGHLTAAREGLARCLNARGYTTVHESKNQISPQRARRSDAVTKTVADAVEKLRATHRQSEADEDQRMQVIDQVDARINEWKCGKEINLRALLCGLQTVLWAELAWAPVALGDLITSAQVKQKYMRAIAKVHPDKVGDVSVERRMISNAVFSILNTAWEAFKGQNELR